MENRIEVTLPVFEIVYGAQWTGESLQVGDATVVFPYIDDATTEEVLRGIIQNLAASEEGEELE